MESYQISYCLDSRDPLRWTTVEVGSNARQFTVTGLSSEQTYVFRLNARTAVGWGEEQEARVVTAERRENKRVRTVIASCAGMEMSASVPQRNSVADSEHRPVKLAAWKGEKPGTWYSQFRKGKQFSYSGTDGVPIHIVQLNFLKLLSATATQSFTYHCLNSAAWLHTATYGHEHALRFRGSDGEEMTHENTHYISALYDGCQTRSGQERTVLEFQAPLSTTLPIMDVTVSDFGSGNQKFGFQFGPVCFNG
ncbi:collagen alpha-3(V) chain-like [Limanda limanda]|uniref:collagen alpha-3(V) chain-like n=1 Tax=Limanda limanda TaxID=27771 RepID=UPI0029C6D9F8|nr:collagen alpha-3(V) chain-like [Limanda limanda]